MSSNNNNNNTKSNEESAPLLAGGGNNEGSKQQQETEQSQQEYMAAYAMAAAQYEQQQQQAAAYYQQQQQQQPPQSQDPAAAAAAYAAYTQQMAAHQAMNAAYYYGNNSPGATPLGTSPLQQQASPLQQQPPPQAGYYNAATPSPYPQPPPMGVYGGAPPPPQQKPPHRPPRAARRSSGKLTPSPAGSARKTYEEEESRDRSGIPNLQDIFSSAGDGASPQQGYPQATEQSLLGSGGGGYGSTAQREVPKQQQTSSSSSPPQVYNAPNPRGTLPPSNPASRWSKNQPILVRTGDDGAAAAQPSKRDRHHQRSASDLPQRGQYHPLKTSSDGGRRHRRVGSSSALPPTGHRRMGSRGSSVKKPTHRRGDSLSSMQSYGSKASMSSAVSVTSNIGKSAMFGGVDETTGLVQMHFPFEAVRLVMINTEHQKRKTQARGVPLRPSYNDKETLEVGHLYWDGKTSDPMQYEDYTRTTEELCAQQAQNGGPLLTWETLAEHPNLCGCPCNNCNGCTGTKGELLPRCQYVLAVHDNVYRRVVGEIADAHQMPCGLFFCGHHEDVAYPSIIIPVIIIAILFGSMAYASFNFGIFT